MCNICREWAALREQRMRHHIKTNPINAKRRCCDECGVIYPEYPGWGRNGFQAHTIDHYHTELVGEHNPRPLNVPVMKELCLTCYRKDQIRNGMTPLFTPPYDEVELDRVCELPTGTYPPASLDLTKPTIPTPTTPDLIPKEIRPGDKPPVPDHLKDYLSFTIDTQFQ